ncbi:MAG: ankyrin repeat domain-containing protein [Aquabacterium sp.]
MAALMTAGGGAIAQPAAALLDAARRGDADAVRRLLDHGAAIDTRDGARRTPLLLAVQAGHDAVAQLLVERGADINAQDEIDDSAFLLAGARGRTAMLRAMLLPPTGSPDRPDYSRRNRYGGSALIPACHYGHVDTVRLLLQHSRIDVDHVNRLGWTALLEAVILGDGGPRHAEIVRLLLAHRADPSRADAQGVTPLAHARQRGQAAVAALLQAAGAR